MATTNRLSVVTPANSVPGPKQGHWTYQDYAALPDDGRRYEIMDGVLLVSPSPSPPHQRVTMALSFHLYQFVNFAGIGEVLAAPLDVELAPDRVFQPDVLVLLNSNLHKVKARRIIGVPDLVIEVASPGTSAYDRLSKALAYAQAGIEEYWIVDVEKRTVEVLILQAGNYQSQGTLQGDDTISSHIIPNLSLAVKYIF